MPAIATVTGARVLHPAVGDLGTPMMFGRTTYNHSAERPQALLHGPQQPGQPARVPRLAARPGVRAKTLWFYTFTRRDPARLRLSLAGMRAGLRGDFTGHERFLPVTESVAVVVVTFNRADLLTRMLDGLAAQTRSPDAVFVVDNASTDHTREILTARREHPELPLQVTYSAENLGGAGGFRLGVRLAHDAGHDRIWLVDDDVVPAPDCLEVMLAQDEPCVAAIREDLRGRLVEKAALEFDLRNPLSIRPKRSSVEDTYAERAAMPRPGRARERVLRGIHVPP